MKLASVWLRYFPSGPLRSLFLLDPLLTRVHVPTLTFHLATVLGASLVCLDWHLKQRLQVGHRGQVSTLGAASSRVAGPKLRACGPGREIRW